MSNQTKHFLFYLGFCLLMSFAFALGIGGLISLASPTWGGIIFGGIFVWMMIELLKRYRKYPETKRN